MRSRRLAGAGLLALLCLVACQGKAPVIPILPMSVPDGVLRVGVASLPASTDPALTPAYLDGLGLKAADDRTFVVQLAGPAPDFKWIASVPAGAPARGDAPPAGSGPGPGNGPFRLDSLTKDRAVLLPNDHYWAGRPHLARVELSLPGEAAADLARFKQQQEELTST